MKKEIDNKLSKISIKVIISVVLLVVALLTACGKTNSEEPVSSTQVEVTEESKDFSINLAESQLAEVETLSDEDLATYQSEAQELEELTEILPNGEVVEETTYEAEELKLALAERLKSDILSGEVDIAILDDAVSNVLGDYDDAYKAQVKEEIQQAYNEKFVSPTPTQVAKQESKPSVQETNPADTSKSDQSSQLETQPQPQPTQPQITEPTVQDQSNGSAYSPEGQALLDQLLSDMSSDKAAAEAGAQQWQDGAEDNQVKWNGEERNITIK